MVPSKAQLGHRSLFSRGVSFLRLDYNEISVEGTSADSRTERKASPVYSPFSLHDPTVFLLRILFSPCVFTCLSGHLSVVSVAP